MNQRKPSIWILLLLMPFASISAVLFAPALPELARWLQISAGEAQATMTVFLVGYALGNLPYGPFANRFGRKSAIYLGTLLAIIGFSLILFAGNQRLFGLFLVGRFLSALGSSVGMKISFTMIGDVFEQDEATKKIALSVLAFAIAPGLAVAIGGILTMHYGWESCFYALIIYSLFLLCLSFLLPETARQLDKQALNFKKIKEVYGRKLKNKKLVYSALIIGCATSIIYLFSALAPFLGINRIGLTPEEYGFMNFIPPLGMLAGSWASHWLATRKERLSVIKIGGTISVGVIVLMLFLFLVGIVNPWTLFFPMPFLYFGLSLVFTNAAAFATSHMQDKSNGSAVMSFINIMTSVVALFMAESAPVQAPSTMPLFFLLFGAILLFLQRRLKTVG